MAPRLRHDDYTVGWVCALPIELAAAREMFNEPHDDLPLACGDPNIYTLGRIGKHNVVLACLPAGQTGTNSAASVALHMNSTFRAIRFGLMVGIGGGVPREDVDIRLGDIVVSQPGKGHGGVIQFDFGKSKPNEFERTGFLNSPPPILLSAVSKLQAKHKRSKSDLISHISSLGRLSEFDRDKAGDDILFEGAYDHVGGNTCASCDKARILQRDGRPKGTPEIHYGAIVSGNQVMRDGKTRDKISSEFGGALCFEMEAAGLMNSFPCLVIRGICDYADSHKNKAWQSYAAITAAAYATELLEIIPADDVTKTRTAKEASKGQSQALGIHYNDIPSIPSLLDLEVIDRPEWKVILAQYRINGADLLESLSNYNYQRHYSRQASKRLENTAKWILTEPEFESWLYNRQLQCLWLTGIIGSGKSVILAYMTSKTSAEAQKRGTPVLHYFFHHSYRQHLTARSLFESYAKQLLHYLQRTHRPCPPDVIGQIVEFYAPKKRPPTLNEVVDGLILPLLTTTVECVFIIDGLDECNAREIQEALRVFKKLLRTPSCRVLVACREEVDITRSISGAARIRITPERTKADMEVFITHKLDTMQCSRQLSESENILAFIKNELMEKADRMFLWAELQIQLLWDNCIGEDAVHDMIYRSLRQLPDKLDDIYGACFQKANQDQRTRSLANRALKLICAAVEPFQVRQLQEALVIDPETGEMKSDLVQRGALIACCASFISLDTDSGGDLVLLAHASVRQFLLTSPGDYDSAELELGGLCVTHLYRHMPVRDLGIYNQGFSRERLLIGTNIPSNITKSVLPWFLRSRHTVSSNVSRVGLLAPARPADLTIDPGSFKYYAKEHWVSLTRCISTSSPFYSEFERIALSNNKAWWIFPWKRHYESHNSHVAAIYGWSIMHSHYGLLSLTIDQQSKVDKSIYKLPLYDWAETRTWLPFQAAAKIGDTKVAQLLLKILPQKELDAGQPSPLLIAVQEGYKLMRHFLHKAGISRNLATLEGHGNWVNAVAFSPDGRRLASGSDDETVRLWDGETGIALATLKGHSGGVNTIVFSPDSRRLTSGSDDETVRLWDSETGAVLATLKGHSNWVNAVAFSPDGRRLTSGSGDETVRLWDCKTGTALETLKGHGGGVNAIAFSPDGRRLASGSGDKTVRLWDSKTGVALATLEGHGGGVNAVAFSPDSRRLASGSGDETVRLWDGETGAVLATLKGHGGGVNTITFSPDGRRLASGSGDKTVRLWDSETGVALAILKGHSGWVNTVVFSPDGRRLASGSYDKTVQLWDSETGAALATLEGHSNRVNTITFSPDGRRLASGSYDKTVRLWDGGL